MRKNCTEIHPVTVIGILLLQLYNKFYLRAIYTSFFFFKSVWCYNWLICLKKKKDDKYMCFYCENLLKVEKTLSQLCLKFI